MKLLHVKVGMYVAYILSNFEGMDESEYNKYYEKYKGDSWEPKIVIVNKKG